MTTSTHLPPYWREHLLAVVGGHLDAEKLRFLAAWAQAEGGNAKWNPLNSTFELPGATPYNSFDAGGVTLHVWNYPRPTWGIVATALTLTSPATGPLTFPTLLAHLQAAAGSYTAEQILDGCDADIRRWGTSPDVIRRILAA